MSKSSHRATISNHFCARAAWDQIQAHVHPHTCALFGQARVARPEGREPTTAFGDRLASGKPRKAGTAKLAGGLRQALLFAALGSLSCSGVPVYGGSTLGDGPGAHPSADQSDEHRDLRARGQWGWGWGWLGLGLGVSGGLGVSRLGAGAGSRAGAGAGAGGVFNSRFLGVSTEIFGRAGGRVDFWAGGRRFYRNFWIFGGGRAGGRRF